MSATKEKQPSGWPPTVFGLAWQVAVSCVLRASTPARYSSRRDEYGNFSRFCNCASSTTGCTSVAQLLWPKNFSRLCRTSRADLPRSWVLPASGMEWRACSKYSSGVMGRPLGSRSSSMKSRSTQSNEGRLASLPRSSTCSANLQERANALKRPSLSAPLVLSTSTEERRAQRVISWASLVRSDSVLPKPSQSMKASSGPRASSRSELQSQSPSVHAREVLPTWNEGWPCCTRSASRFRR
mmetsp:Transcript_72385/g.186696  ORF Transcript_72385/g.186696 Transcript_72385/m.186696 type:complete len:240 (+) Transcript_72385:1746-2465(+)